MDFTVRNLQGVSGLDGAFRVHIPPDTFQAAGLVFNELCSLSSEDGRPIGCGIVWRAGDKLGAAPKTKPIRLSEVMRDAFGIKEGSTVKVAPLKGAEILHADRLVLTDVTLDLKPTDNAREGMRWQGRCKTHLYNAEAIAIGTTFDVQAKKGLKKRFAVEHIASNDAQAGVPHLYYVTDDTKLELEHGTDSPPPTPGSMQNGAYDPAISTDGIGGLLEQIEALNTSMRLVLQQTTSSVRRNYPVILHGYEGTGKSLLLNRVADSGAFRKTLRINSHNLDGTISAKKTAISDVFSEARNSQPSLILLDNLNRLAPSSPSTSSSDEPPLLSTLCQEIDSISGTRTLVLAATRSLHDIHADLLGPGRFIKEVELPIPDLNSRRHVLRALLLAASDGESSEDGMVGEVASRTHGFTCRDLAKAVAIAKMMAVESSGVEDSSDDTDQAQPGAEESTTLANSATVHDPSDSDSRNAAVRTPADQAHPTKADWDIALTRVRPAALREILFTTPSISWSDIGGSTPIRQHLDRVIGWPLKHADLMKRHKLPAKKGMLLYGPPGCSKTLTAQAVAATYEMNFIVVKGAELISMYVGESERSVREIFRKARAARPCIIFFDEIDSIASERESSGGKGLNVLTTLLNEMDGFESLTGVFVLAATNKPQALDPAIMRPGRFDQHLYLGPPTENARREILEMQLRSCSISGDRALELANLVEQTSGYTGAELVAVCNLAKEGAFERLLGSTHIEQNPTLQDGDAAAGQDGFEVRRVDFDQALKEIIPRVTDEMLSAYELFGKRG